MALRKDPLIAVRGIELCVADVRRPGRPCAVAAGRYDVLDGLVGHPILRSGWLPDHGSSSGTTNATPAGRPPTRWVDPGTSPTTWCRTPPGFSTRSGWPRRTSIGISMGGAVAQLFTLAHPDRVLTLTLISTTAGAGDDDLPGHGARAPGLFRRIRPPNRTGRIARPSSTTWSSSPGRTRHRRCRTTPTAVRAIAEPVVDRTRDIAASMTNHHLVAGSGPWRHRLAEITAPTLVIHGTEDPFFQLAARRSAGGRDT